VQPTACLRCATRKAAPCCPKAASSVQVHGISRIFFTLSFLFLGGCVNAAEYFYLTHYAPILESKANKSPPVDNPSYADTVIYIDEDRFDLYGRNCNGKIEKILPFTQSRAFTSIIADEEGDIAFDRFLKTKIHTDINQWKKRYLTKFPENRSDALGCELLQKSMIFRSTNEIIITDTTYFYQFLLGRKPF
jgi:hypothetical protein